MRRGQQLEFRPLTGTIGAEVTGADLVSVLDERQFEELCLGLRTHKVVVFRNQNNVRPHHLLEFGGRFGDVEMDDHPLHPFLEDHRGVVVLRSDAALDKYEEPWHTDGATRANTRWISILQGVDLPPYGRDTVFADMEAAFERISPPLQEFLRKQQGVHSWGVLSPDTPGVKHPATITDPVTGRTALYLSHGFTRAIDGCTPAESKLLLDYFFSHGRRPEAQVRVSWEPGTIVMWDNQKTEHYLVMDKAYPRVMHRVMVCVPDDALYATGKFESVLAA